jgi:hypothetical protein
MSLAIEKMADSEWRKICSAYEHYTSEDYLALYELFIDAFVKGYKAKGGKS